MTDIFLWVGFLALTGVVAALAVAAWGFALSRGWEYSRETWWIAAWACHKRSRGGRHKEELRDAIRAMEKAERADREADR